MKRASGERARLKSSAESARRPRTLALWGERGSGKSGVVGALRSESTKSVGERWTIDLEGAHGDVVELADSASLALRLRDVKSTVIRRPERAIALAIKRYSGARVSDVLELAVLDPTGAIEDRVTGREARDVMHALATADGILWLVDAARVSEEQRTSLRVTLLRQVVAMLAAAGQSQLRVPVVVALSKVDRLPAEEMRRALDAPEAALRAHLGDATFGWMVAAFPYLRCFALSSSGIVRNAARPIGLTTIFDWFPTEWRRSERQEAMVRARARRSERVARLRRRAPIAALVAGIAAVAIFAGAAGARRLGQSAPKTTWNASSGGIAPASPPAAPAAGVSALASGPAPSATFVAAVEASARGAAAEALDLLARVELPKDDPARLAADSLLALAALRVTEDALRGTPSTDPLLRLVLRATSDALARSHPGTSVVAPLSLARAEACLGGRLECRADQLREDLAWVVLLGTPGQQDEARRLRAAWLADTSAGR